MRIETTLALALAVLPCGGCLDPTAEPEEEGAEPPSGPKRVRCGEATSAELSDVVVLRGTVAPLPDRDAQVAAQVAGRIVRVEVREGDRVTAGQVVARVDAGPLVDQVHEADAALAKAKAERTNAETTLGRVQRVFEHGIAARQEVDDASAQATSAKATESAAAAVAQQAHRQLDRALVQSPLAGVVLRVMRRSGELVDGTAATPILEVGDPAELELVADAPAQDMVRVKGGDAATVEFPALPGVSLQGRVAAVSPALDRATGLGMIRVALDLTAGGVAPPIGAYGVSHTRAAKHRTAVVVAATALRAPTGSDAELVMCGQDRVAHVRKVQRGEADGARVEISGGLRAGERIVIDPVLGIAEGDALEVVP